MNSTGESTFWYHLFVNGVIAVCVFFLLAIFNGFLRRRISYPSSAKEGFQKENESCASPNCIRCRASLFEKETLLLKLREFLLTSKHKPDELERLNESLIEGTRLVDYDRVCAQQRPTTLGLLGLSTTPWHHGLYSSDLEALCSLGNLATIKAEVAEVMKDFSTGWAKNTTPTGSWWVYHLYNQGKKFEWNCEKCPRTVELIDKVVPFMKDCAFGNAVISVISPGTNITEHYGPTNCRIRCHLPLAVPDGCGLTVDLDKRLWKEGEPLLFDDSFLHKVSHTGTTGKRVVLMLDLWHPEVTSVERKAICYLFSTFNMNESAR